jgi:electron transport complex protein RnfG
LKEVAKLVFVLTTICFVAALALSQVYEVTKEPIAYQKRLEVLRAIRAVLPEIDNEPDQDTVHLRLDSTNRGESKEVTFFRGRLNGELTGVAFVAQSHEGYGGNIEIMLGVDPQGTILGVEILSHLETPGLGSKITEKPFRRQFIGRRLEDTKWAVRKDGGDIDQITGATISPRAVVKAVEQGLEIYQQNQAKIVEAQPSGQGSVLRDQGSKTRNQFSGVGPQLRDEGYRPHLSRPGLLGRGHEDPFPDSIS